MAATEASLVRAKNRHPDFADNAGRLSTAFREFAALRGLPFYEHEMLADILAARSAVMPRISEQAVDNAKKAFDVNEPQARAILGAMDVRGFALIQG